MGSKTWSKWVTLFRCWGSWVPWAPENCIPRAPKVTPKESQLNQKSCGKNTSKRTARSGLNKCSLCLGILPSEANFYQAHDVFQNEKSIANGFSNVHNKRGVGRMGCRPGTFSTLLFFHQEWIATRAAHWPTRENIKKTVLYFSVHGKTV